MTKTLVTTSRTPTLAHANIIHIRCSCNGVSALVVLPAGGLPCARAGACTDSCAGTRWTPAAPEVAWSVLVCRCGAWDVVFGGLGVVPGGALCVLVCGGLARDVALCGLDAMPAVCRLDAMPAVCARGGGVLDTTGVARDVALGGGGAVPAVCGSGGGVLDTTGVARDVALGGLGVGCGACGALEATDFA